MFGFVPCEGGGIRSPVRLGRLDRPLFCHASESEERARFTQRFLYPVEPSRSIGPSRWVGKHVAVLMPELIREPSPEVPSNIQPDHGSPWGSRREGSRGIIFTGGRLQCDGDRFVVVESGEAVSS